MKGEGGAAGGSEGVGEPGKGRGAAAASTAGGEWVVFDYGAGNLHSLTKALSAAGAGVRVTADVDDLVDAAVVVLPGVGAFGAVMERLEPGRDALRARHRQGRPILGVCIGQQVLYEASEEAPGVPGLDLLSGTVRRLPAGEGKVPHMGWNQLQPPADASGALAGEIGYHAPARADGRGASVSPSVSPLTDRLFAGLPPDPFVYYVHSYAAPPDRHTVATTRYGMVFCAALRAGATVGLQFHPEKSSAAGQQVLRNVVAGFQEGAP